MCKSIMAERCPTGLKRCNNSYSHFKNPILLSCSQLLSAIIPRYNPKSCLSLGRNTNVQTIEEPGKDQFLINTEFCHMTVMVLLLKTKNNYLIKRHLDVWFEDVGSGSPRQNIKPPVLSQAQPQTTGLFHPIAKPRCLLHLHAPSLPGPSSI